MAKNTRRDFIAKSTLVAAGVTLGAPTLSMSPKQNRVGPNDKIRMGFIGVGNRGSQLLHSFMQEPDVEVAALCDVYEPYRLRDLEKVDLRYMERLPGQVPKMGEKFSSQPRLFADYRRLLEDNSIDAVCIATPDHWHALQTIDAINAGKDVYVEKPLTITLAEGRRMVEVQAASKQVVAVGLNRRGSSVYQQLSKDIPAGKIGKVSVAAAFRINDQYPTGIGMMTPEKPPKGFDWDMWLGPRAYRPYQYNIAPYQFRWWSDYSSQMGNWGVHFMDVIRWMLNEKAPVAISAHGGNFAIKDDRTIPDTMHVTYEFASGCIATFSIYEGSSGGMFPRGEVELRGTKGTLHAWETGYAITPARPGQFQDWKTQIESESLDLKADHPEEKAIRSTTSALVRDFLDKVRSRGVPLCTLEDGHRSTSFAHLANIAFAVQKRLRWDPDKETFPDDKAANELLSYTYRSPWNLG